METAKLVEFFKKFWGTEESYVYTPTLSKDEEFKQYFHSWPADANNIALWVLSESSKGNEVYFAPATFKSRSSKKEAFKSSRVIFCDFDGNAPLDWDDLPTDQPEPSLRVRSSIATRQHAYWFADEPITDINVLENINRSLAYELGADTGGWDATQVLRPPYTTNYGYGKRSEQYPVVIESESDITYPVDTFPRSDDFRKSVESFIASADIPHIVDVLVDHNFPEGFSETFRGSVDKSKSSCDAGKACTQCSKCSRSDRLTLLAYYAMEGGCTDEEAYSVILDADSRWQTYIKRTDKERRYADIIERARAKIPYAPLGASPASYDANSLEQPKQAKKIFWGYREFIDADIHIEWIYDSLISKGSYGLIVASPGVGKTQLALQMTRAMCTIRPIMEWKPTFKEPLRVMFLSLEMTHAPLKHFLTLMEWPTEDDEVLQEHMVIIPAGEHIPIDTPQGYALITALIKEAKPDVIIVDSLSKICSASLTDDDAMRRLVNAIAKIRVDYACSFIAIHHDRKSTDRKPRITTQDDIYGSRFLVADADWALTLNMVDENTSIITRHYAKSRLVATTKDKKFIKTERLQLVEMTEEDVYAANAMDAGGSGLGLFGQSGKE